MMPLDLPPPAYVAVVPVDQGSLGLQRLAPFLAWVHPSRQAVSLTALASVEHQIEELANMHENWDGYGALPISPGTKYNSLAALGGILQAAPQPEVTPNQNGTLSFEWETSEGSAHLEVGQTKISFYLKPSVGAPVFVESNATDVLVLLAIGNLVSTSLYPKRNITSSVTLISMSTHVSSAH